MAYALVTLEHERLKFAGEEKGPSAGPLCFDLDSSGYYEADGVKFPFRTIIVM